jgi:hypothetical protein
MDLGARRAFLRSNRTAGTRRSARLVADPADLAAQHDVLVPEDQHFGVRHARRPPVLQKSSRRLRSTPAAPCTASIYAYIVVGPIAAQ